MKRRDALRAGSVLVTGVAAGCLRASEATEDESGANTKTDEAEGDVAATQPTTANQTETTTNEILPSHQWTATLRNPRFVATGTDHVFVDSGYRGKDIGEPSQLMGISKASGNVRWRRFEGYENVTAGAVANGRLYVGVRESSDANPVLHEIAAETGETAASRTLDSGFEMLNAPYAGSDVVVFGLNDGPVAVESESLEIRWTLDPQGQFGTALRHGDTLVLGYVNELVGVTADGGAVEWRIDVGSTDPVFNDGFVYLSGENEVHRYSLENLTGGSLNEIEGVYGVAATDQAVLFATRDVAGALSPTGDLLWEKQTPESLKTPVIISGAAWFAANDELLAYEPVTGTPVAVMDDPANRVVGGENRLFMHTGDDVRCYSL